MATIILLNLPIFDETTKSCSKKSAVPDRVADPFSLNTVPNGTGPYPDPAFPNVWDTDPEVQNAPKEIKPLYNLFIILNYSEMLTAKIRKR